MMPLIVRVTQALLAATNQVMGVVIPDPTDKSTWIVSFYETATDDDRALAQAVIDNFVL